MTNNPKSCYEVVPPNTTYQIIWSIILSALFQEKSGKMKTKYVMRAINTTTPYGSLPSSNLQAPRAKTPKPSEQ